MAGHNVVVQLGAQIQVVATTLGRVENSLETVKKDLGTLQTDVAVLKKEVRLIWAALFLAVPTLTAVVIRLFAG